MAIDSAEKRKSASGVPFHPLGPGVTPNTLKDLEWRQQAAWGYSGILVTVEVVAPTPSVPGYSVSRTRGGIGTVDFDRYRQMERRDKQRIDFERIVRELVHDELTDDEFLLVGAAVYYYGDESITG